MSSIVKAYQGLKSFLARLNIKAPYKYTGINSTFEYNDYRLEAETYRTPSPASGKKCYVPESEPEHVFNIRYFDRKHITSEKLKNAGLITQRKLEGIPLMKVYGRVKRLALTDDGADGGYAR